MNASVIEIDLKAKPGILNDESNIEQILKHPSCIFSAGKAHL
jgi:hypothetical protein